jgi:hypothetical protein
LIVFTTPWTIGAARYLPPGLLDGLLKAGFCFRIIALHEQQLSVPVALARLFHHGERLGQRGQAFLQVACLAPATRDSP